MLKYKVKKIPKKWKSWMSFNEPTAIQGKCEIIEECKTRSGLNEDFNSPRLFRNEYFVDTNQKIHDCKFFDNGRDKPYESFEFRQQENPDAFFETIVSDPQNDEIIRKLIADLKQKYTIITPKNESIREEYERKMKKRAEDMIVETFNFFGGKPTIDIEAECKKKIQEIQKETKRNLIYLGKLEKCGLCRHRSILFKLLCDTFGIRCRILRGWIRFGDKEGREISCSHMWNEIVIGSVSYCVDTMNFEKFVGKEMLICYCNLGHPCKILEARTETIEHIKETYEIQKKEKACDKGAFGRVFLLPGEVKVKTKNVEDGSEFEIRRMRLAVKEINIDALNSTSNKKFEKKNIEKEIEMMNLMRHRNVVDVIGSFERSNEDGEQIVQIVMRRYQFSASKLLRLFKKDPRNLLGDLSDVDKELIVFELLFGIAMGLRYIHSFGIVHFDIKPQNVLLDFDKEKKSISNVVISDFGSSKTDKMNRNLTSLPAVTGKYCSPEAWKMISGSNEFSFSTKSDVFSFGIIMKDFHKYFIFDSTMNRLKNKCVEPNPEKRPSFTKIIKIFHNRFEYLHRFLNVLKTTKKELNALKERKRFEELERKRFEELKRKRFEELERKRFEELERKRFEELERKRFEELERKSFSGERMKRISSQYQAIQRNPPPQILSAGPKSQTNIYEWQAMIAGLPCSPYENGIFLLSIVFPSSYPFQPPQIKFTTKIYHPNVRKDGYFCCGYCRKTCFLGWEWRPDWNIFRIFRMINEILYDPDPDLERVCDSVHNSGSSKNGRDKNIMKVYNENRTLFNRTAREWTKKYAR